MKKMKWIALWVGSLVLIAGCSWASAEKPPFQSQGEAISNKIAEAMTSAVPYPVEQMKDSVERRNLRERLIRFNNPEKVGYIYLLGMNGNFVGYYVINGKPSSTQSQMTNPDQSWKDGCGNSCENITVVESIGDDGSYGPNEGGDDGIFFITSNGVLVETTMDFVYSDAPLNIKAPELLAKTARPSTTASDTP